MGSVSKSALLSAFAGVVLLVYSAVKFQTDHSKAEAHLIQGIQLLTLAGISHHTSRIGQARTSSRETKD